ncbi:zinc ribbon domain-containing protein [Clostridium tyrobutyricum]|uniref:zinc ribbon domain-containing protein n=1 Tax=Clostridium tyrobutyricum TaxID=1519 RepID=UPI002B21432A|nr:C4-type zinc ribbon domain-containing protein [Clostridium tyrobutyricum]MEA5007544.1 C4-type zinc ribbon domain-containing protein [Clostridium tyrobutyricum]
MLDLLIEIQENRGIIKNREKAIKDSTNISYMKKIRLEFEKKKKIYMKLDLEVKDNKRDIEIVSLKLDELKNEIEEDENKLYSNFKYDLKLIKSLEKSINTKKEEAKDMEDKSLNLLYKEDDLIKKKSDIRKKLVELRDNFYEYRENNKEVLLKNRRDIEDSKNRIVTLERQVPKDLLEKFNEISRIKGTGAAKLSDNGVCLGCLMKVSAITIDNVKKDKETVYCDNCGRIIHYRKKSL